MTSLPLSTSSWGTTAQFLKKSAKRRWRGTNKKVPIFQIPETDFLLSQLAEAKFISTLDLESGFWQIPLTEESSNLMTFATPFGRFRFKRLPFGISSAPEQFHRILGDVLKDIPGVLHYIDDALVHGKTREEHDQRVAMVQKALAENGLTLNLKKCVFCQTRVKFLGHIIENGTVQIDPEKVRAISEFPPPTSKKRVEKPAGCRQLFAKISTQFI